MITGDDEWADDGTKGDDEWVDDGTTEGNVGTPVVVEVRTVDSVCVVDWGGGSPVLEDDAKPVVGTEICIDEVLVEVFGED